ncbi:MAG: cysteine hydrolase [Chromatiales bacterium]|nr:cysteine hydrolase [Chromatiales bacterium]
MTMKITLSTLFTLLILSMPFSLQSAESPLKLEKAKTALLVTDPQTDFLDEKGIAYGLFAENIKELGTIPNIEKLFLTAKQIDMPVFVSPHAYFQHDHSWENPGALQKQLLELKVFNRKDSVYATDLRNTGADFLTQYKKYILDGETVVTSPHKIYGPDSNDLVLQLRMQGIDTVILAGLAANLCTDSHMRELVENGFKVVVVKDAVAAPGKEAYQAALVNFGLIANQVVDTKQAVKLMTGSI